MKKRYIKPMAILLSACIFSGCSFMDLKWDTASSDLKISGASNNATAEAYYDAYGNKLGITLSIYLVSSTIVIPEYFAGEKVVSVKFSDVSSKTTPKEIYFPDSVISFDSLNDFTGLTTVYLPASLQYISSKTFGKASALTTIILPCETPPVLESKEVFSGCNSSLKIYVPQKSLSDYQTAEYWSESEIKDKLSKYRLEGEEEIPEPEETETDEPESGDSEPGNSDDSTDDNNG